MLNIDEIKFQERAGEHGDRVVRGGLMWQAEVRLSEYALRNNRDAAQLRGMAHDQIARAIWHKAYGDLRKPAYELYHGALRAAGIQFGDYESLRKKGDALMEKIVFPRERSSGAATSDGMKMEGGALTAWNAIAQALPFIDAGCRAVVVQMALATHGPVPDELGYTVRSWLGKVDL